MAAQRKVASSGVEAMRALVESWIAEAEQKLAKAEKQGAATAGSYLQGRLDGYRDCLSIMHQ